MRRPARLPRRREEPVLVLEDAVPALGQTLLPPLPMALQLCPGDFVLLETGDARRAEAFADLCAGLLPLVDGNVRFLGVDWARTPPLQAASLRGRIGRIHGRGAWADPLALHLNVMLPELHHTRRDERDIEREAADLARRFGLPGLPVTRAALVSDADLARAACVRAFLGEPSLLLLENPVPVAVPELMTPLLNAVATARDRGAAALCIIRDRALWRPVAPLATRHFRLGDRGLFGGRGAGAAAR